MLRVIMCRSVLLTVLLMTMDLMYAARQHPVPPPPRHHGYHKMMSMMMNRDMDEVCKWFPVNSFVRVATFLESTFRNCRIFEVPEVQRWSVPVRHVSSQILKKKKEPKKLKL